MTLETAEARSLQKTTPTALELGLLLYNYEDTESGLPPAVAAAAATAFELEVAGGHNSRRKRRRTTASASSSIEKNREKSRRFDGGTTAVRLQDPACARTVPDMRCGRTRTTPGGPVVAFAGGDRFLPLGRSISASRALHSRRRWRATSRACSTGVGLCGRRHRHLPDEACHNIL